MEKEATASRQPTWPGGEIRAGSTTISMRHVHQPTASPGAEPRRHTLPRLPCFSHALLPLHCPPKPSESASSRSTPAPWSSDDVRAPGPWLAAWNTSPPPYPAGLKAALAMGCQGPQDSSRALKNRPCCERHVCLGQEALAVTTKCPSPSTLPPACPLPAPSQASFHQKICPSWPFSWMLSPPGWNYPVHLSTMSSGSSKSWSWEEGGEER